MQPTFYFTAISLYMFRVPSTPIIRSTLNYSYSNWYKSYLRVATSQQRGQIRTVLATNLVTLDWGSCTNIWLVPVAVTTVSCTPDDGCGRHLKHVEWYCSKMKYRPYIVASRWTFIDINISIVTQLIVKLDFILNKARTAFASSSPHT
jgi:hypothetical protein